MSVRMVCDIVLLYSNSFYHGDCSDRVSAKFIVLLSASLMFYTRFYSLMSIDHNGTVVDTLAINTHSMCILFRCNTVLAKHGVIKVHSVGLS